MKTEKEKVLEGFVSHLKSYYIDISDSYYYISSCTLKAVLVEVFGMSEEELKPIEDDVRENFGGLKA